MFKISVTFRFADYKLTKSLSIQENDFYQKFESTIFTDNMTLKKIRKFIGLENIMFFAPNKNAIIDLLQAIGFSNRIPENELVELTLEKISDGNIYTIILKNDLFDSNEKILDIRDRKRLDELLICTVKNDDRDDLPF